MKTCPVCKTSLFDDMEVCYGCMYTFGSKPELEQRVFEQRAQEQQIQRAQPVSDRSQVGQPAVPMAGWTVRLEMKNTADPTRSWSMELAPTNAVPMPETTAVPSAGATLSAPCATIA